MSTWYLNSLEVWINAADFTGLFPALSDSRMNLNKRENYLHYTTPSALEELCNWQFSAFSKAGEMLLWEILIVNA